MDYIKRTMRKSAIIALVVALGLSLVAGTVAAKTMSCCAAGADHGVVLKCCQPQDRNTPASPAIRGESPNSVSFVAEQVAPVSVVAAIFGQRVDGTVSLVHSPPAFLLKASFLI